MCTIFPLVLNSTRTVEFHILLHFLHLRKVPNTLTVNGKDEENNAKCSHYSSFKAKDIDRNTHWPVQKKKRVHAYYGHMPHLICGIRLICSHSIIYIIISQAQKTHIVGFFYFLSCMTSPHLPTCQSTWKWSGALACSHRGYGTSYGTPM